MRALSCAALVFAACAGGRATVRELEPGLTVRGQQLPAYAVPAQPDAFAASAGTAVLHYYGSGGWLIQWGDTVVLTAPYFTNHSLATLLASRMTGTALVPDFEAMKPAIAGTPLARTRLVLVGHGHVDHTADLSVVLAQLSSPPALIADRSTTNQLAALAPMLSCVAPIDYFSDPIAAAAKCPVERVRITPVHHAHAPHLQLAGLDVAAFSGRTAEPQPVVPHRAKDYKLGNTWAYLIDLLDAHGDIVFRIHYVDAAAEPPHALAPPEVSAQRDVDVHIACVPGFEQTDDYPDAVLAYHHVKYALLAHWEDFLHPRSERLEPLRNVLDEEALDRFVTQVERVLPSAAGVTPEPCARPGQCGVRGAAWAMPVPGETFRFVTGAPASAPRPPPRELRE